MKKFSLLVAVVLFSSALFAQTPKIGVKAGLNISNIAWTTNTDSRFGAHIGLLGHVHLAPQWALQPEVIYSQEGAKQDVTGGSVTWKNDYVNLPLMIQYMFDNGFRIEAGPQLGLLVNSKAEDDDGVEGSTNDVFKSTNVSLGFGLNYLSYSGLGVGGRYNLGLSKINEPGFIQAKANTFQLSLFYLLDNHHKAKSR